MSGAILIEYLRPGQNFHGHDLIIAAKPSERTSWANPAARLQSAIRGSQSHENMSQNGSQAPQSGKSASGCWRGLTRSGRNTGQANHRRKNDGVFFEWIRG